MMFSEGEVDAALDRGLKKAVEKPVAEAIGSHIRELAEQEIERQARAAEAAEDEGSDGYIPRAVPAKLLAAAVENEPPAVAWPPPGYTPLDEQAPATEPAPAPSSKPLLSLAFGAVGGGVVAAGALFATIHFWTRPAVTEPALAPSPQAAVARPAPAPAAPVAAPAVAAPVAPVAAAAPAPVAPQPPKVAEEPRSHAHARHAPKRASAARVRSEEASESDPMHLPNEVPPPPPGEADDEFDHEFGKSEAQAEAAPEAEPKAKHVYIPPEPGSGAAEKQGLSDEDIMQVVLAHKPDIVECVKVQHEQDPGTGGRLVMRWKVLPSGAVSDVGVDTAELESTYLAGCVAKQLKGWRFPKSEQGQPTVSFPFTF